MTACSSNEPEDPSKDPAFVTTCILDAFFKQTDTEIATKLMGNDAATTRGAIVSYCEQYYLSLESLTFDQVLELSEKLVEKSSALIEYRAETTEKTNENAKVNVYVKTLDTAAFYAACDEYFTANTTTDMTDTELNRVSFEGYMHALDNLKLDEKTEYTLTANLAYRYESWQIDNLDKLISDCFNAIIGNLSTK